MEIRLRSQAKPQRSYKMVSVEKKRAYMPQRISKVLSLSSVKIYKTNV